MGVFSSKLLSKKHNFGDAYEDTTLEVITSNSPSCMLAIDPRSPTSGIARTPIEVLSKYENEFDRINKSCNDITTITPRYDSIDDQQTPNTKNSNNDVIRKRLLKSSSLKNMNKMMSSLPKSSNGDSPSSKSDTSKLKIGLLETNLDYQETDIDHATKIRNSRGNLSKALPSYLFEELNDPRSPAETFNRTPVRVLQSLNVELRSPSCEIIRTPIQILDVIDNITLDNMEKSFESSENSLNAEEIISNVSLSSSSLFISKSNNDIPSLSVDKSNEDFRKSTPDIPNIDVPLKPNQTKNLIYEDAVLLTTPQHKIPVNKPKSQRTPLSIRNGTGFLENIGTNPKTSLKKSVNREFLQISKIPTYKKVQLKKNQQCENTPPTSKRHGGDLSKGKHAQWDGSEKTMII